MFNNLESIEPETSISTTNPDSNDSDKIKELNMSVEEIDKNKNSEEMKENGSKQVVPSNILKLDNAGNELLNDADHNTNFVDDTTKHLNYDSEDDSLQKTASIRKKKIMAISDNDSDEENNVILATPSIDSDIDISTPIIQDNKKKHRRLAIVDSDSDIDNEVLTSRNKSFTDEGLNSKEQVIFTTNSKGELVPETSDDNFAVQKSRLSILCDPESSDEEMCKDNNAEEFNFDKEEIKPKPYRKKSKPKKDDEQNPRKMTGKEAAELRKEIKSESQRMVREMNVSLPYHKPKSHTLKEFLARRSKFVSVAPFAARNPPSVAIKMTNEQLVVITKQLKEREKEVKEFYKSESESEDDDEDKDCIPPTEDKEDSHKNNDYDCNTKNIDPMVVGSDEIKDNGQDSGIDLQEISNNLRDHSDEDCLTKLISIKERSMVGEETTNQVLEAVTVSDKSSEDFDTLVSPEDYDNSLNISDNLNDEKAVVAKEEVAVSDKSNVDIDTLVPPEDYDNSLNISDNLNDEKVVVSKEDVTVSDKSNVGIDTFVSHKVYDNNLNSDDKLDNEKAPVSKETEDVNDLETVAENNIVSKIPKPIENTEDSSTGYEFYLDDLEEHSERLIEKYISEGNGTEKQKPRFEYTDLDREIENFGLNGDNKTNESAIVVPKLTKLELIKEGFANFRPKLSGGPDHIIDLDSGVAKPNDVTRLMERFAQHNLKKHMHKNKVKLSIVSVESGKIHEETVALSNKQEDDLLEIEEKPGVKLQRLRDELQSQIVQRRSEFWQKKNKKEEEESTYEGEREECGMDDDILDDEEEEAEMTDISEDEEIDDVEDDRQMKIKKSGFIDEEAEESDKDDDINEAENDDDIDADIETKGCPENDLNVDENSKSSVMEKFEEKPVKKSLRRIIKGFADDSDDEDENIGSISTTASTDGNEIKNFDSIVSQDDYFLPPHQPQNSQTPVRQMTQDKSQLDFFPTPVSYITGLQNLNHSASKSSKGSPIMSLFQPTNVPSPLKENNWHEKLQKKLFTDTDITDSQLDGIAELCFEKIPDSQESNETNAANEDELVKICSGTFPSSLEAKGNETQLAELCSGAFPSILQADKQDVSPDKLPSTQDLLNICSGKFTGATQTGSAEETEADSKRTTETYTFNTNKEMESLDADQDMIISQLIDEEEMEKFKKKFDSPLLSNTQRRIVEEFEEVVGSGGVIDSDDEDEILEVKKKKKQKRLMFSDDENSDNDEKEEEVIDLHDDVGSENDEDAASDIPADNIGYDSEENEIELTEEKVGPKLKPSDFFENEAELSESEWGSADEDEKYLDTMEFEQGDTEKFDEKKMRSDLEKIHMRRLLDDDTREVKMLQELLLEDGELHGTGRERQFKWKNINLVEDENEERKDEDDVYLDEEESEEQWRKRRYEREMFLKEKQEKVQYSADDDDLLSESQLLQIGHKVLQRSQSSSQGSTTVNKSKVTPGSPDIKQPFSLLNKRGSFLSRSDHILQRLAEYSKVVTSAAQGSAKNSRKFLFQTVSVETSISINQDKKRKATDGTPKAIKKLRLSENFSPAVSKKNPDKSAKAKLFGNW